MLATVCLQPPSTASTGGAAGELSTTSRNRASSSLAHFDNRIFSNPLLWFLLEAHSNTRISLLLRYTAEGAKPPGNKYPLLITEQRDITWSVLCPQSFDHSVLKLPCGVVLSSSPNLSWIHGWLAGAHMQCIWLHLWDSFIFQGYFLKGFFSVQFPFTSKFHPTYRI